MAIATRGTGGNYLQRAPSPSGLAEVLDVILDKGIVVDAYVRVALVGIEVLTIDARIVIASVDTYLHFAEAVNRLDLSQTAVAGLPELMETGAKGVAQHKVEDKLSPVGGPQTLRRAAKGVAAGAVVAGAAAAAKALSDRARSDGTQEDEE